jgi:hypothetical protein
MGHRYLHGNMVGAAGSNALADALAANVVEKRYVSGAQRVVAAPAGFEPLNKTKKRGRSMSPGKERPMTAASEPVSPKAASDGEEAAA